MYNFIPFIIIFLCLFFIIFVIVKKFSVVKVIDVGTIKEEAEAEKKEKILMDRLKRKMENILANAIPVIKKIRERGVAFAKKVEKKVKELERKKDNINKNEERMELTLEEKRQNIGQNFINEGKYAEAENIFLELINDNQRNIKAYEGLFDLYNVQKEYAQAKETMKYIVKLEKSILKRADGNKQPELKHRLAEHFFTLSQVDLSLNLLEEAYQDLGESIIFCPNNPKYLDQMLEVSIKLKKKSDSFELLSKLKAVNPENQKLDEFEEKISQIEI